MPKKLSPNHKKKISDSLKKYHRTCKKSKHKSSSNTDKKMKSFLAGIKTKSKSKSKSKSSKKELNKQLQKEIKKLKQMIK